MSDKVLRFQQTAEEFQNLQRLDGWQNDVTGLGDSRFDRAANTRWARQGTHVNYDELANSYQHDDVTALVAIAFPEAVIGNRGRVTGLKGEALPEVTDRIEDLDLWDTFFRAMIWEDLFGGSAVLLGTDEARDRWAEPLVPGTDVRFVFDLDPREIRPVSTGRSARFSRLYRVSRGGFTRTVHRSRLILFRGLPLPDIETSSVQGWGWSPVLHARSEIAAFSATWSAIRNTIQTAGQSVLGIEGLRDILASGGGQDLIDRVKIIEYVRSILGAILLDKDTETWERRTDGSLSGLSAMAEPTFQRIALAVGIPVEVLLGRAPSGLNSAGDFPRDQWNARVRKRRAIKFTPRFKRAAEVIAAGLGVDSRIELEFSPLHEPTEAEKTAARKSVAEARKLELENIRLAKELGLSDQAAAAMVRAVMQVAEVVAEGSADDVFEIDERGRRTDALAQSGPTS